MDDVVAVMFPNSVDEDKNYLHHMAKCLCVNWPNVSVCVAVPTRPVSNCTGLSIAATHGTTSFTYKCT